jgi:hypothetical protein
MHFKLNMYLKNWTFWPPTSCIIRELCRTALNVEDLCDLLRTRSKAEHLLSALTCVFFRPTADSALNYDVLAATNLLLFYASVIMKSFI